MGEAIVFSTPGKEDRHWNRKILNIFWFMVVFEIIAAITGVLLAQSLGDNSKDVFVQMLLATCTLVIVNVAAELIVLFFSHVADYVVIVTATVFPFIIIGYFPNVDGIQLIAFTSILISAFYYQRRKVFISCALNLVIFLIMLLLNRQLAAAIDIIDIVITIGAFIFCTAITIVIMNKGKYLLNNLKETMTKQQDLLIRNALMDKVSKIDALTELYNHKTFHEYLEGLIEQSKMTGLSLQLAILDIDNFKQVNDAYGHSVGDIVLKRVADVIKNTVTMDDFASRYGGEEFAIIFTDKSWEQALLQTNEILVSTCQIAHEEMDGKHVTVSIGLRPYIVGESKDQLFRDADAALYIAKRNGKNQVVTQLSQGEASAAEV